MASMALGDTVQVIVRQILSGQQCQTVLYCTPTEGPSSAPTVEDEEQYIADFLKNSLDVSNPMVGWKTLVTEQLSFVEVQVQRVKPTRNVYRRALLGYSGEVVNTSLTPNICMSISKQTDKVGRTGIGRIQLPGVPDEEITNGMFSGEYQGDVNTWAQVFTTPFIDPTGAATYHWCLPGNSLAQLDAYWVKGISANSTVRTMHRRTVGLGI